MSRQATGRATPTELAEALGRRRRPRQASPYPDRWPQHLPPAQPDIQLEPPRGRYGRMNPLELRYAIYLDTCMLDGTNRVDGWDFEALKFRLADGTEYRPDFTVYFADGRLELHDVKAVWRRTRDGQVRQALRVEDDAAVKIKLAADRYPRFRFYLAWCESRTGCWRRQAVGGGRLPSLNQEVRHVG